MVDFLVHILIYGNYNRIAKASDGLSKIETG